MPIQVHQIPDIMLLSTNQRSLRRSHQAVKQMAQTFFLSTRFAARIRHLSTNHHLPILPPILPPNHRSIHPACLTISLTSSTDPTLPSLLPTSEHCSTHQQQLYQNPSTPTSFLPTLTKSSLTDMSTYEERLASFTKWPHALPTPEQMARTGFRHTPTNEYPDNVSCRCGDGGHDLCGQKLDNNPKLQVHIHNYRCSRV